MSIKKNANQEQQYFGGIKASWTAVNLQNYFYTVAGIHCNHGRKHQHSGSGNSRRPTSLISHSQKLNSHFKNLSASNSKGPFENDSRVFSIC